MLCIALKGLQKVTAPAMLLAVPTLLAALGAPTAAAPTAVATVPPAPPPPKVTFPQIYYVSRQKTASGTHDYYYVYGTGFAPGSHVTIEERCGEVVEDTADIAHVPPDGNIFGLVKYTECPTHIIWFDVDLRNGQYTQAFPPPDGLRQ